MKNPFEIYQTLIPNIRWADKKEIEVICPFHDDQRPSLSINTTTGLWFCHRCNIGGNAIMLYSKARGISYKAALTELNGGKGQESKKITAMYDYVDKSGKLVFQVVRMEPKTFRQRRPDGNGAWAWNTEGVKMVPYNLPEVLKADTVFIVEGEKDVESLRKLGLIATTNPRGAGKWRQEFNEYFKDKEILILPDNDQPGRDHAQDVAMNLYGIARSVKVIDLPDLPKKGDVSDWVRIAGNDKVKIRQLISETPEWIPAVEPEIMEPEHDDLNILIENAVLNGDVDKIIKRLAGIESEIVRAAFIKKLSKKLGVDKKSIDKDIKKLSSDNTQAKNGTAIFLKDSEPWPEPVDGAELLNDICNVIKNYCVMPTYATEAVSLWTLLTYVFAAMTIIPILAIKSPEKRSGKTTLLTLLLHLCRYPLAASNISPSALFRAIEKWHPTLLIDEGDTFLSENEELRGIINSGHTKSTAFVIRTVGDDFEVRQFLTWGPKVIALIGNLPATITDRSIVISMFRKKRAENTTRLRVNSIDGFEDLRRKCMRWANDNIEKLKQADPDIPPGLHDRAADNWTPLLAIADLVESNWPKLARQAAIALSDGIGEDDTAGVMLLADIEKYFTENETDKVTSADLCSYLHKIIERPWPEWRKGKPITPRQVAKLLSPFGILPATIRLNSIETAKGYKKEAFIDAFQRYLPNSSVTPSQSSIHAGLRAFSNRHKNENVTDKNSSNSSIHAGCDGVTDEKGGISENISVIIEGDDFEVFSSEISESKEEEGTVPFRDSAGADPGV